MPIFCSISRIFQTFYIGRFMKNCILRQLRSFFITQYIYHHEAYFRPVMEAQLHTESAAQITARISAPERGEKRMSELNKIYEDNACGYTFKRRQHIHTLRQ